MRAAWLGLAALAAGCGGDKDETVGDTSEGEEVEPVVIDCTDLPQYDLPSLDCGQLASALESTIDAALACNSDQDCQVVAPNCTDWNQITCFYPSNYCIEQAMVTAFVQEAAGCAADDQCVCGEPPQVTCVNQRCELVDSPAGG